MLKIIKDSRMKNDRSITLGEIEELGACSKGIAWFEETFGSKVSLEELLKRAKQRNFKIWIVNNLLTKNDEDVVIESNDAVTSYYMPIISLELIFKDYKR